jgi:hypothetical protein
MIDKMKVMLGLAVGMLQLACVCRALQGTVIAYPRAAGDRPNSLSVKVNGIAIDTVYTDMNVGYAHFAFSGTVVVEVTAKDTIKTFDLSPHRYGIHATASDNVLSFQLSQPRKLQIKINDEPRFFIFADPPEVNPPQLGRPGVYDLRDYEVSSSHDLVQTSNIQRAIDDAASKREVLYVPPGIYRSGQLKMKSNLTLYLAPGAIIKGTGKASDYPCGKLGTQQIYLLDCKNVRIKGRGVIDGQGRALRFSTGNGTDGRMKLLRSLCATNCIVEDVILRDAGTWGIHLVESSDLRFTNYKLLSNTILDDPGFPWEPNTDGFDPDNCSRVIIENGFISSSDDAIAVKLKSGTLNNMDDIQFRNNVVWSAKSALKIGTEVYDQKMTNIVFENNEVIHADRGIAVYCYRGATIENPKWINNYFEFIGDDRQRMNMEIEIRDDQGKVSPNQSRLQGLDGTHVINGVKFENLVIAGKKRNNLSDAQITVNSHVRNVSFE